MPQCSCCKLPAASSGSWCSGGFVQARPCPELPVFGDPSDISQVEDADVVSALMRVFGRHGIHKLFGCPDATGARRINCGGLNHIFMVAHRGRLVKCMRPRKAHFSEAQESERLRRDAPKLALDAHAIFPSAVFQCREQTNAMGRMPCEVLVFEYLEGCRTVGDVLRMFERTHPTGLLQSTASCQAHRGGGTCEHAGPLRALVGQQAIRLNRRFQALHGRRHGDFKADNILLDRRGVPRLADFLSPYCQSCDREEFLSSIESQHPVVQEMKGSLSCAWRSEAARIEKCGAPLAPTCAITPGEAMCNAQLMESLERLNSMRQSQPLFGPMPSLLQNIGLRVQAVPPALGSASSGKRMHAASGEPPSGSCGMVPLSSVSRRQSFRQSRLNMSLGTEVSSSRSSSCSSSADSAESADSADSGFSQSSDESRRRTYTL